MAPPPFWLKLNPTLRNEFDAEIRARGYADCCGLSTWLSERGCRISKTAIHRYIRLLREQEQPELNLSAATTRAAVDFIRALQTLLAQLALEQGDST